MALTDRAGWKEAPPGLEEYQVASTDTIYDGALVGVQIGSSMTTLRNWSDAEGQEFVGVARVTQKGQDNVTAVTGTAITGVASVGVANTIGVDTRGVKLLEVTLTGVSTYTQVGALVYGVDENTFSIAGTQAIGYVTKIHAAQSVDVQLFSAGEARGL